MTPSRAHVAATAGGRWTHPLAQCRGRWAWATGLLALAAVIAPPVLAAPPTTVQFEGVLRSAGGGPAADGAYELQFALYAQQGDVQALWSEKAAKIGVQGGAFVHALGSVTAIDDATWAAAAWLGVRVGAEPELPRQPLHAVAFARRAGVAAGLSCTGCVSLAALAFDGDIDLGGHSIKAKNLLLSGDLSAKAVLAQTLQGDGSKLAGVARAGQACKAGEAVIAIAADGSVQCKALGGAGGELSQITGGLLTSRVTTVAKPAKLGLAIPDNTGVEAVAQIAIGDLGAIDSLVVKVKVANSNLAAVRVVLLPPDDKQVGITLCDPCGGTNAKELDLSWPPAKPSAGDLAAYLGKSAKGTWTFKVLDTAFCVPQLPGNAALCDLQASTDGTLIDASIHIETLTKDIVTVPGTLVAGKGLQLPMAGGGPCDAAHAGAAWVEAAKGSLVVCDGADWRTVPFEKACGNGIASGEEQCDDGNNVDTDACRNGCKAAICGDGVVWAGKEACDDGNTQDGDGCSADCSKLTGKPCSNGSFTDCQPAGQTLIASSAFVDLQPPSGWVQCLGFVNTAGDDLGADAMGNCMFATQLRLKVWDAAGQLVVDVWEEGLQAKGPWSSGNYYDGCNCGKALNTVVCGALWPCNNNAGFYGSNNGQCGGGSSGWGSGQCLSNGNGGQVSVAPGRPGSFELAQNPTSGGYENYKVAIYKQP